MKAFLQLQKSKWNEESEGHNDADRDGLAMVGETRETHKGHDYSANNGSADQSSINWIVCWRWGLFRGLGQFKHFRVVHVDESALIRFYDDSRLPTAPARIGENGLKLHGTRVLTSRGGSGFSVMSFVKQCGHDRDVLHARQREVD
jgi:hypothetical protein